MGCHPRIQLRERKREREKEGEGEGEGSLIFCTDHERYEYEPTAVHAYKQGMAAALLRSDDTGIPSAYIDFAKSGLLA